MSDEILDIFFQILFVSSASTLFYLNYKEIIRVLEDFLTTFFELVRRNQVIRDQREIIRTRLAKLIKLRESNAFYKNIGLPNVRDILGIRSLRLLKEVAFFLEMLVRNAPIFADLNPSEVRTFVDIGTCGYTAIFRVLGIDWYGFNGEADYAKKFSKSRNSLEQLTRMLGCTKVGKVEYHTRNFPAENNRRYDITFLRLTLHHLGKDAADRVSVLSNILDRLWRNTDTRLIFYDWIIKQDREKFSYVDKDGGEYLSLKDFLSIDLVSHNIHRLGCFSEENGEWFKFMTASKSPSFTYGDFFKFYIDRPDR